MRTLIIGLGRIGRLVARDLIQNPSDRQWVGAVEVSTEAALFAYLLNHDSTYGHLDSAAIFTANDSTLIAGQHTEIPLYQSVSEALKSCDPELIIECSGDPNVARTLADASTKGHFRVIFSSQTDAVRGRDETFVWVEGVNHAAYNPAQHRLIVNPGCLNNCLIPALTAVNAYRTIVSGTFVSVHSVTNTQPVLDHIAKHARWSRAGFDNLIPAGHEPSQLIARFFPALGQQLIGQTVRAPVSHTSYVTLTLQTDKPLSTEGLSSAFLSSTVPAHVLGLDERALVSSDYKFDGRSAIIDATNIRALAANTAFFSAWYNNEWAFAARMSDISKAIASHSYSR